MATSSLYEHFESDKESEEQGTPVEMAPAAIFYIRSAQSVQARKWLQKRIRKNRQLYTANHGVLTPAQQDVQDAAQCAEVLVTKFEGDGVKDRDGNVLAYSPAAVLQLVKDLPQLRRDIIFVANEAETFRKRDVEELAGNSAPSSNES